MSQQSTIPLSTVTFEEVVAKLIKSKAMKLVAEAINNQANDAWNAERGEPLADLKHHLDRCATDDAIVAWIKFLEDNHLWRPDLETPESVNQFTVVEKIATAITELEQLRTQLKEYEKKFDEELAAANPRFETAHSPTGTDRYLACEVASWSREQFGITILEWEDLANYNLYGTGIPHWIDTNVARHAAYFDVLNALLRAAMKIDLLRNSPQRPPGRELRLRTKNGDPNVSDLRRLIEHQLWRLAPDSPEPLLKESPGRDRLYDWYKWFSGGPSADRPIYSDKTVQSVRALNTGLIISLADDSYLAQLTNSSTPPYPLPSALGDFDPARIDGVHRKTVEGVLAESVEAVMLRL